jgi:hypothetical protein
VLLEGTSMSRKIGQRFCDNDMRKKTPKARPANLKDRDALSVQA